MNSVPVLGAPIKARCPESACRHCNGHGWRYDTDGDPVSCDPCRGTGLRQPPDLRPVDPVRLLSLRQAANVLQISVRTLHRLLNAGKIRRVKVGSSTRVNPQDLGRFVEGCAR
jgi:excisionase family DNA binding protein